LGFYDDLWEDEVPHYSVD